MRGVEDGRGREMPLMQTSPDFDVSPKSTFMERFSNNNNKKITKKGVGALLETKHPCYGSSLAVLQQQQRGGGGV